MVEPPLFITGYTSGRHHSRITLLLFANNEFISALLIDDRPLSPPSLCCCYTDANSLLVCAPPVVYVMSVFACEDNDNEGGLYSTCVSIRYGSLCSSYGLLRYSNMSSSANSFFSFSLHSLSTTTALVLAVEASFVVYVVILLVGRATPKSRGVSSTPISPCTHAINVPAASTNGKTRRVVEAGPDNVHSAISIRPISSSSSISFMFLMLPLRRSLPNNICCMSSARSGSTTSSYAMSISCNTSC